MVGDDAVDELQQLAELDTENLELQLRLARSLVRSGRSDAAEKVRRYEYRPGEELYDVEKDPYEWNNLAGDPKYATVKERMKRRLLDWMKAMGDKGQQTELEALEHQYRNRNKKPQSLPKKRQKS